MKCFAYFFCGFFLFCILLNLAGKSTRWHGCLRVEYVSKISPCGGGGGASEGFFVLFCLLYEKLSKDRHHLPAQTQSVNDAGPGEWWTREAAAGFAARADVLNESHDHVTVCSGDFLLITTFFPLLFYLCYILRFLADWNFSTNAFGAFFFLFNHYQHTWDDVISIFKVAGARGFLQANVVWWLVGSIHVHVLEIAQPCVFFCCLFPLFLSLFDR